MAAVAEQPTVVRKGQRELSVLLEDQEQDGAGRTKPPEQCSMSSKVCKELVSLCPPPRELVATWGRRPELA